MLADIVSKGGNLLLNIAPGPDGKWDAGAYKLLEQVGDWMKVNGEAIYSTRPLAPYRDGKLCFTRGKTGARYAIYLADDGEKRPPERIWLPDFNIPENAILTLLGNSNALKWQSVGNGVLVEIPEAVQTKPPCEFAWVIKIFK